MKIPYALIPPLHDALFDEILRASNEEKSAADTEKSFTYKYYLIISSVYKENVCTSFCSDP